MRRLLQSIFGLWLGMIPFTVLKAQAPDPPQFILHNGKIVTMDDDGFTSDPGTIGQAMAIRDGKVLAVGPNQSILSLAGPQTRKVDLKGRTVLPGLIDSHDHLFDWVMTHDEVVRMVVADRDLVARKIPGNTIVEIEQNLEPTLRQALDRAGPGKWVHLAADQGKQNENQWLYRALFPNTTITKELLDKLAPQNPVTVRGTNMILNQRAIEALLQLYPEHDEARKERLLKTGLGASDRVVIPDIMFGGQLELFAKLLQKEMEWWAGMGITAWHSRVDAANVMLAFQMLDRQQQMVNRFGWSYDLDRGNYDPYVLSTLAAMVGQGSPYFWMTGVSIGAVGSCTTLENVANRPVSRGGDPYRESCDFRPGSRGYQAIKDMIRFGLPIRNLHTGPLPDKDIDFFLLAVAEGAKEAHLTDEQVRAQRQAMDHCYGAPRPDQIPLFKKFGIIASCKPFYVYYEIVDHASLYGERYVNWVVPRKSLIDAGVITTTEIDRAIGPMVFNPFNVNLYVDVTRKAMDGNVYAPHERIDRVQALKAHTIWGAYYLLREDQIGSLKPGKWADFIILDRDYLAVPEDDIPKILVLATALGGKFVHVRKEIAAELGESPKGALALAEGL
ncbi:MAG: amidohydrolase family protein [Acidobacteria bacterium]|nr:amidohydrolase family protein [Acidobacteriota bacterium]